MKRKTKYLLSVLLALTLLMPTTVYAADKDSLTYLFQTRAFSGSMETISKFNWVGALLSGIISVFCLIGLFLVVFRIITSIMYLSGRNVFDKIHDIKSSNQGSFFGIPTLFQNTIHGTGDTGSGVDTFIYFFLGLMPDVKMYSDFADGAEARGISQDTTVTEYMLKISIPTIMMIFFLSIGYSGVLWQMFGTVVDAMSVAAERVANTSLEGQVKRLLDADSYYNFAFGDDGSKWGKLQENIAKSMYNKALSKSDESVDGDVSLALGSKIGELFVSGELSRKNLAIMAAGGVAATGEKYAKDDLEAKNIKYSVVINSIGTASDKQHEKVFALSKLSGELKIRSDLYIHVFVYRKESAIQTNYFTKKSDADKAEADRANQQPDKADFQQ